MNYTDTWFTGSDGLELYARDYPPRIGRRETAPVILCMHGLTRNSADFHNLAEHLSGV